MSAPEFSDAERLAIVEPKPCVWICRRHGALPDAMRTCDVCDDERDTFLAAQPGQLTIEDVA